MSHLPISFVMTTYNHGAFIAEALAGVFAQDYPVAELVVADDASTDDTWEVLQKTIAAYAGPIRVVAFRQPENIGPLGNLEWTVRTARHPFQVRGHGDDVSMPDRVSKVVAFRQQTGATLIAHNAVRSDGLGTPAQIIRPPGVSEMLPVERICAEGWTNQMLGATFSWDRRIFDVFGFIDPLKVAMGGDIVLPVRGALLDGFGYLEAPLILWRRHAGQQTHQIADFSGTSHVKAETLKAFDVGPLVQRLVDLHSVGPIPPGSKVPEARQLALQLLLNSVLHWWSHRTALARGRRVLAWRSRGSKELQLGPESSLAIQEVQTAQAVGQTAHRILTLHQSREGKGGSAELNRLAQVFVTQAQAWVGARNRILRMGLRPAWQ